MKLKFKIKVLIGIIFFLLFISLKCNSFAASANITCDTTMTAGETKTITVSGSAVQWNLTLYVDGVALATNRELENYEGNIGINFSAQYTPSSEGNKKVELKGSITDADSTTITSFSGITISVSAPAQTPAEPETPTAPATPTKSSNANLKNLVLQPVDFTGFKSSKTSGYSVTVENDVTKVTVIPTLADSKASYEVTGNTNLKEGTNVVKILVTAEDGTQKTYQVNVVRKVASAEVTPNIASDTSDTTASGSTIGLSKLEVKGMKLSPEFSTDVYRYIVWIEDEEISGLEKAKELINAEVNFEGGTFEIIGEEEFNKDENEVIVSVKDADGREIAIYTIVFKYKVKEDTSDSTNIIGETIENEYKLEKEKIIVIASIVIISIIAFISSINSYKQRKILKENGLIKIKEKKEKENNDNKEEDEKEENNNIEEIKEKEENKDYINDIFENKQMQFEANDNDFTKRKNKKGKHSQD
ncbi:MAG: cadherin-like beta sandwich domain-containing protein [Candidatus Scatovivens sp.]